MGNEIRYYLSMIKDAMQEPSEEAKEAGMEPFVPQYIITATKLPTGAIELATNTTFIAEKIDYILEAYDDDMHLKTNPEVVMQNIMIV